MLEQDQEIFECIRIGIQERIDKLGTSNVEGYEQGLLIWKLYMELLEIQLEKDEDEGIDMDKITPELVFEKLDPVAPSKEALQIPTQQKEQSAMYASDDSDNESDFEVRYEQQDDNYEDLTQL